MKQVLLSLILCFVTSSIFAEEYKITAFKNVQPPLNDKKGFFLVVEPQVNLKTVSIDWKTKNKEIPVWSIDNKNNYTYIRLHKNISIPFDIIINKQKITITKIDLVH